MCCSVFHCCDKIPENNHIKEGKNYSEFMVSDKIGLQYVTCGRAMMVMTLMAGKEGVMRETRVG